MKEGGCPCVIVVGRPEYYSRFGFEPIINLGVSSEWGVPEEAFMILMLDRKAMNGITGVARYRAEWAEAM